MAEVIYKNKKIKVKDNSSIEEACKTLGVPFSCSQGYCGICKIKILEGKENLNKITENEKNFFDEKEDYRLACQCVIKKGSVKIDF
ncbi:MAG: 2Fe-2S iron-sulfur cluster-binding protein [Candidatus Pacearchaeota archaeon]